MRSTLQARNAELKKTIAQDIRKNTRPLNIAFYVTDPAKWACDSLYQAMAGDAAINAVIAVDTSPVSPSGDQNSLFFKKKGFKTETLNCNGSRKSVMTLCPDIVFYQQPWYIAPESAIEEVSKSTLTAYIPYSFMLIDDKKAHYSLPFHLHLWRYFCENDVLRNEYLAFCPEAAETVQSLGYPKIDGHVRLAVSSNSPHIIYAPHWSISSTRWAFSTFETNSLFFLDYALSHPGVKVTLRPHPNLRDQVIKDGFMTPQAYEEYLSKWSVHSNTCINEDADYLPLFYNSSLMATDCVSFLAEYLITGNPIVRMENTSSAPLNSFGREVLSFCYPAQTDAQLIKLLDRLVFTGKDDWRERRQKASRTLFPQCGQGGERIKSYLKKELLQND
jgi:hypothetical protein